MKNIEIDENASYDVESIIKELSRYEYTSIDTDDLLKLLEDIPTLNKKTSDK